MNRKKLIVLSSPSGGGKSTIARYLLSKYPDFSFSVSATTRAKRGREREGVDYFYLTRQEFTTLIENGQLIEYEEIFGNYYGTLKSFVDKALADGKTLLFDIDVKGALSIRQAYPVESLLIFLVPPSKEELERRLKHRNTESEEQIAERLSRAQLELSYKDKFDQVIINKDLNETCRFIEKLIFPD